MEGLKVATADLMVYVHPSNSGKVEQAVRRQVSSLLFHYNESFEGVVLAYTAAVEDSAAQILPGVVPCVAVGVKSKLLLFSPQPGMYLEGKVAKVGREFVHAVVLGFASAAVSVEDVRGEFRYRDRNGDGVFASRVHRRHRIGAGSVVRFVVKSFDEDVLHISGSLMPGDTGCVRYLCKYGKEDDSGHGGDWSAMHENITDDGGNSMKERGDDDKETSQMHGGSGDKVGQFDAQGSGDGPKSERLHKSKRRKTAG